MDFTVENISALKKRVVVTISNDLVENKIDANLEEIRKSANLPGFRKNKAPKNIIARHYGKRAKAYAINDLIRNAVSDVVQQENFHIIASPNIDIKQEEPNLKFDAIFEIYPEISEIKKSLYLTKFKVAISDSDLDSELARLQKSSVSWVEDSGKAAVDYKVNISFAGAIDNKEFDGGSADNVDIIIGGGKMISGFEDALLGLSAGSSTTANLTFPDNYMQAPHLSGKDVVFSIDVHKVYKPRMPEVDSDFFKKHNLEASNIDEAKEQLSARLNKHSDSLVQAQFRKQILEKLLMNNPIDVPSLMVNQEAERQRKVMSENYMPKDSDPEKIPLDGFIKTAKKDVAIGLLLGHLISSEPIEVTKEEVVSGIKEYIQDNEMPESLVEYILGDEKQYEKFKAKLVEDKAIEVIVASSQVTTEDKAYAELISSNS